MTVRSDKELAAKLGAFRKKNGTAGAKGRIPDELIRDFVDSFTIAAIEGRSLESFCAATGMSQSRMYRALKEHEPAKVPTKRKQKKRTSAAAPSSQVSVTDARVAVEDMLRKAMDLSLACPQISKDMKGAIDGLRSVTHRLIDIEYDSGAAVIHLPTQKRDGATG